MLPEALPVHSVDRVLLLGVPDRCALSDFGASLPAEARFRSADHNGNPNAVPPEVAHALAAAGHAEADYSGADTCVLCPSFMSTERTPSTRISTQPYFTASHAVVKISSSPVA